MNRDTEKGLGVTAVLLSVIGIAIFFIYSMTAGSLQTPEGKAEGIRASVVERIKPIGEVALAGSTSSTQAVAKVARTGEAVFNTACTACHSTGAAGAPIIGKPAEWAPRIAKGVDGLLKSAINGIKAMPPKGTCADCSDAELKLAVEYMIAKSGGSGQSTSSQPVAVQAVVATAVATTTQPSNRLAVGAKVYNSTCLACHLTGAAGAPVLGNKQQWAPRIAKGMNTLINSAVNGINAMPAKGTCVSCSNADLQAAVEYMVAKSQ